MQQKENSYVQFLKKNPPITLFFICIISLIVATLSLAVYVKNIEKLLKWDGYMDTQHLRLYLNNLQVCVEQSNNETIRIKKEINEDISVSASMPLKNILIKDLAKYGNVNGLIDLKGYETTCPIKNIPNYLEIRFNVNDFNNDNKSLCTQLSGPEAFMKNFEWKPCASTYKFNHITGRLFSQKYSGNFCSNGTKIRFDFPKRNKQKPSVYISDVDKDRIYNYLIFLTGAIIVILIFMSVYLLIPRQEDIIL